MDTRFDWQGGIAAIRKEHRKIDGKWLWMQYRLMAALAAFATAAEVIMYFLLQELRIPTVSSTVYLLKYLVAPFAANLLLTLGAALAVRSGLTETQKSYLVSTLLAVMAFVMYTVHAVFPALSSLFIIPLLLTVVYGDQRLTAYIAACCVGGKAVSDLLLRWDPSRIKVTDSVDTLVDFRRSLVLLAVFYGVCACMILMEQQKHEASIRLEQERQRLREESLRDQLTRVGNREALRKMFQTMEADQSGRRYFLAMMDLDDFKNLNDTYGHSQGDRYLRALGQVLLDLSKGETASFRFGGDEFCAVFWDCGPERVEQLCREIQRRYAAAAADCGSRQVSLSIGVAEYRRQESTEWLLDRADAILYRAKQNKGSILLETN